MHLLLLLFASLSAGSSIVAIKKAKLKCLKTLHQKLILKIATGVGTKNCTYLSVRYENICREAKHFYKFKDEFNKKYHYKINMRKYPDSKVASYHQILKPKNALLLRHNGLLDGFVLAVAALTLRFCPKNNG